MNWRTSRLRPIGKPRSFLTSGPARIILEHAGGYRTLYGHAFKNLVKEGDMISAEHVVGEVGRSGRSSGTHLHFELQKSGEGFDPREFLLAASKSAVD